MTTATTGTAASGEHPFAAEYARVCRRYYAGEMTEWDWAGWHASRLTAVLRHVASRSGFYRRHLAGVDVGRVTPEDLPALPFTTKEDLRREMYAVLSGPVRDAAVFYETTGTTGPATPCPRDALDIMTSNLHVEESWRRTFRRHFGDRQPVVALMGPSELYAFGDTFGEVAARLGVCHAKLWPESPRVGFRKALRLLQDLAAEVVVCAPALCLNLAKAARHYGLDPGRDFGVRLFLVLGEIATPEFAANVTSIWGAEVRPTLYGSQEALAIATGCVEGRLHVSRPNYLLEVVDPDSGEHRGRTGEGELCLTMLVDGIKPLVRYRTGDMVALRPGGCRCDMPGEVVDVAGRTADRIDLGGGLVHPADVESAILEGVRGCLGYQVVVDPGRRGRDEVTVRLDLLPGIAGDPGAACRGVVERLRDRFDVVARATTEPELDPIVNTGAFVSWKAARIQDNRGQPDGAVQAARQVARWHVVTS
jgi:phenylacetate-coenzyme A ligase PaaK-like adenylate-forming protein